MLDRRALHIRLNENHVRVQRGVHVMLGVECQLLMPWSGNVLHVLDCGIYVWASAMIEGVAVGTKRLLVLCVFL